MAQMRITAVARNRVALHAEATALAPDLKPGHYRVEVQKDGFKLEIRNDLELLSRQELREDVTLVVGEVTQRVEVNDSSAGAINSETPAPRVTATPGVVTPRPATPRPTVAPTPRPTAAPTTRATPAPPTPLTFAGAAQNTVRRYLADLIAGNENAAYAELGKSPGEGGLTEEAFIDRGTRITSIRTTHADASGATVEVELTSSRGTYYATYHVVNGPNGPVIDQHDYIKV